MTNVIDAGLAEARKNADVQTTHDEEMRRGWLDLYRTIITRADSDPQPDDAQTLAWLISPDYLNLSAEQVRADVRLCDEARRQMALHADSDGAVSRAARLQGSHRHYKRQADVTMRFIERLRSCLDDDRRLASQARRSLEQMAAQRPEFFEADVDDGLPQLIGTTPQTAAASPGAVSTALVLCRRLIDEAEQSLAAARRIGGTLLDHQREAVAFSLWQLREFSDVERDLRALIETGELPQPKKYQRRSMVVEWFARNAEYSAAVDELERELPPQDTAAPADQPATADDAATAAAALGVSPEEFALLQEQDDFPASSDGTYDIEAISAWMAEE